MNFKIIQSLGLVILVGLSLNTIAQKKIIGINSPSNNLSLSIIKPADGSIVYTLDMGAIPVLHESKLGIKIKDEADYLANIIVDSSRTFTNNTTWKPVWGEVSEIRDNYTAVILYTHSKISTRRINIEFRLFDDGLGFRYLFPISTVPGKNHMVILDEFTTFQLTDNHLAYWVPMDFDSQEYPPSTTRLSEVKAKKIIEEVNNASHYYVMEKGVQTPLMLKNTAGSPYYINIHEAALVNYPVMQLAIGNDDKTLKATLVPDAVGNMAYLIAPESTPWRTVIVSPKAEKILESKLILNLNEPCKIENTDWIKPMKYVGIWWEMHIGKASWEYSDGQNPYWEVDKKPNGRHGANTQNTKRYIDFAAANGFDGVLVEGWNVGWEDWFGKWKEDVFDFVTPYPDFDVAEVSAYAKAKGVSMIMHHETSGSVTNYERQMDTAFRFMNLWGYPAVKSGYVGNIIPRGEHHDGQWMIRHYTRAAQKSASYNIMINSHESARLTGLHRTYPNYLAAEAARGQEFNAWSKGNAPDHETILPFTRIMGGPMDYTPGIFRIALNQYDSNKTERVHTTLVKQLALYVVLYSPLQMAADLPENYEAKPDAFKFIKDVAVDWDDTKVLRAEPGDYIITARKAKGSNTWFMGGITDENARTFDLKLDFLDKDKTYTMTVYADAPDADYERNAEAYVISTKKVKATDVLKVKMARSGGVAVSFTAN